MSTPLIRLLLAGTLGLMPQFAAAANPTLDELIARAKRQEAAGHEVAPPGDNVVETTSAMMNLIATATPEQLAELVALLDRTKIASSPATPAKVDAAASPPVVDEAPPTPAPPPRTVPAASPPVVDEAPPTPAPPPRTVPVASPPPPPAPAQVLSVPPSQLAQNDPETRLHAIELLARGHAAESRGDVSEARRFYMSAAGLNSPEGARCLGRLYDPDYLSRNAIGGLDPDPAAARKWYRRAVALGDVQAGPLLEAMSSR